jgi:predicted PurR-regulated permease PerM
MQSMAGSISTLLANLVLIYIYFIFLLYYRSHIKQFLLKLSPQNHRPEMENIIKNTTKVSQQYLIGLSKMIFLLWVMYGIGFSVIGVKNAIFFAILCGILEVVPYVGNIFGTLITIFIASLQGGDTRLLIQIAIVYGIVQTIQGWLLEPLILGPQVKINPLFTIVVLIIGQLLWGISGIILAIPLTAMFKIICDHIPSLKSYGFLIGEIEISNKNSSFLQKIIR